MSFILVAQLPNLYVNMLSGRNRANRESGGTPEEVQRRRAERQAAKQANLEKFIAVQQFIPPLWLPYGALGLAENRVLPALLGTLGCAAIGAFGLRRAYHSTVKFHRGETGGKASAPLSPATPPLRAHAKGGRSLMERRLAGVPEPAAAVALSTFRSQLRAPEVKMTWGTSFLVTVVVGASLLFRAKANMPDSTKPFVVVGALTFSIYMLVQFLANQFGFDRHGFRALVLSPVERRLILLGKNLATWPVGATFGGLLLVILAVWLRLPVI